MRPDAFAQLIDHTLLTADATPDQIVELCREADDLGFKSVCVPPCHVKTAARALAESPVLVGSVVGFPFGFQTSATKAYEAAHLIDEGADELDMVINIGRLKYGDLPAVLDEVVAVVDAAAGRTTKVILETGALSRQEIIEASRLVPKAGAQFVKTCTGYGPRGVTVEDVQTIASAVESTAEIKASGGIRSYSTALQLTEAGATRLGTSSGPKLLREAASASAE